MQIPHCKFCGLKLPELDASDTAPVDVCDKCAAARGQSLTTLKQVSVSPTLQKSSAARLPVIEATSGGSDGPSRRTPVGGTPANASETPAPSPSAPVQNTPTGSMGFYFCEKCGKRVTAADLAAGRGRNKQLSGVFCGGCSEGALTLAFDAITTEKVLTDAQDRRPAQQRASSKHLPVSKAFSGTALRQPQSNETSRRPRRVAVVAGVVVIALSAAIGVFLISQGQSSPSRVTRTEPSASESFVAPASSTSLDTAPNSGAAPRAADSPAAQQLAEIRAMITTDLQEYAEVRQRLDQFTTSYAGTPEAESAKALRSEIDAAYAKRAEEALSAARSAAQAGTSNGTLDEAESKLRSIESRFGNGAWFESKGRAAVAEALAEIAKQREAQALKDVAATIEQARTELQAGRLTEAGRLIEARAKWPTESRRQADELAAEIERKVAAAAAAKKLEEEREALLAEFDRMMIAGEYAAARDYAKSKAAAGGQVAEVLLGGERLAGKLADEPAARIRGARTLIGREVRLKLTSSQQEAIVKAATDTGLAVATTFKINRETHEKTLDLKWDALHAQQKAEFARLGGFELNDADAAIMSTYAALGSDDLTAAGQAVGGGSGAPLGVHLAALVRTRANQIAYESAMKQAEELVAAKKLKDAARECEKALEVRPDDEKAAALLAEIRRLLTAPPTLTLDLGNGVTMEFVYIKPGTFMMGGNSNVEARHKADETPKHQVTITKGFYLGKYEATQAQYQAIMGSNPSRSSKDPNCPVDSTQYHQELEFCKKVSERTKQQVRLPTEAEWEYACRAGTDTDWSHGSDPGKLGEYAWIAANSGSKTKPVGQKKPSPWGLYDMYGNVSERVADMYQRGYYASSPKEDPTGAKIPFGNGANGTTILRGGSSAGGLDRSGWDPCESGTRIRGGGYGYYPNWGFRVAVSATGEEDTGTPTPLPVPKT